MNKCILCYKIPLYNFETKTVKIFCVDHKLDGMVNLNKKYKSVRTKEEVNKLRRQKRKKKKNYF